MRDLTTLLTTVGLGGVGVLSILVAASKREPTTAEKQAQEVQNKFVFNATFKTFPALLYPPEPVVPAGLQHWTADPIPLIPGRGYYVVVDLHGLADTLSTTERVRKAAQGEGFTHVILSSDGPPGAGWPPHASGDWYISGVYSGKERKVARSQHDGAVFIKDVWIA